MARIYLNIWNCGSIDKLDVNKHGDINKKAIRSFRNGQCHSLALALNKITQWPIYGICDMSDAPLDPGHVVVKNPKTRGFIDIEGYGALARWRKKWGPVTVHLLTPKQVRNLETYLPAQMIKAIPFAKKVLRKIGHLK